MKCVCPMGGDRTCPESCPLAIWQGLAPEDRKAQRKPVAEQLYRQGFTMEAIATQLGVTHKTISTDLKEFVPEVQTEKRTSKRGRKGEGRPKGSRREKAKHGRKLTAAEELLAAQRQLDEGRGRKQTAAEFGVGEGTVHLAAERELGRREGRAEEIDVKTLSLSAQEKLAALQRRIERDQEAKFNDRVRQRSMELLNESTLPYYTKHLEQLERTISARRGVMDKATYNKIRWCLHSDHVSDPMLKKRYDEAFVIFNNLEKLLLSERDSATAFQRMPRTYDELLKAGEKARAERSAAAKARAAGKTKVAVG